MSYRHKFLVESKTLKRIKHFSGNFLIISHIYTQPFTPLEFTLVVLRLYPYSDTAVIEIGMYFLF